MKVALLNGVIQHGIALGSLTVIIECTEAMKFKVTHKCPINGNRE
jgi:hypothetical protein